MNALQIAVNKLGMRFPGKQLSQDLNISKGVVSEYLNGKRELSENFKSSFHNHYGIDLDKIDVNDLTEDLKDDEVAEYIYQNIDRLKSNKRFRMWFDYEIEKAKNDLLIKLERSSR